MYIAFPAGKKLKTNAVCKSLNISFDVQGCLESIKYDVLVKFLDNPEIVDVGRELNILDAE